MSEAWSPQGSRRDPASAVPAGSGGTRERAEFSPQTETKQSGLWDDAAMQEQGVSKILTINLNDMAKELKIE